MSVIHPKILTPQKLPFRFAWFEEFSWVCYFWWEDRIYYLPRVLFRHKNGKFFTKPISKMENRSNDIQKTSKSPNGNTQKKTNVIHRFLSEYTSFLTSLLLLRKGILFIYLFIYLLI